MKMNIVVEGSRGKSGTVEMLVRAFEALDYKAVGKITGKDTLLCHKGGFEVIKRDEGGFLLDQENMPIMERFEHYDYRIFENQALSLYTMKVVHRIVKPNIIVIPNIRFEHQDRLGETIEEQATSFAKNFRSAKFVVTTETKPAVLDIFKKYAKKYRVNLNIINKEEDIPSMQSLYLTNKVIQIATGKDMPRHLYLKFRKKIKDKIQIFNSEKHGVDYFFGAKVNDVESTANVFHFLEKQTNKDFCLVCYFRKDRVERTEAFRPFLQKYVKYNRIKKIYFTGHVIDRPFHPKIELLDETEGKKAIEYCRENNLVLFTAINGVNDFMRNIEAQLGT